MVGRVSQSASDVFLSHHTSLIYLEVVQVRDGLRHLRQLLRGHVGHAALLLHAVRGLLSWGGGDGFVLRHFIVLCVYTHQRTIKGCVPGRRP